MKTYKERAEAVHQKVAIRKKRRVVITSTASVALCFCILLAVLFVPYSSTLPSVQMYAGSDYYEVIQAIKEYTYQPPKYKNNFEKWSHSLQEVGDTLLYGSAGELGQAFDEGATTAPGTAIQNSSVEITDHQVAGVRESDLIQRSQTHIFYLRGDELSVYEIAGGATEQVAVWKQEKQVNQLDSYSEMYLSADAGRLTLVSYGYDVSQKNGALVSVISLDVSDPTNVKFADEICLTGSILTSRMVGDQLMLMSQYRMNTQIDFEDASTYLPQIGRPGSMKPIPADNIVIPEKLTNRLYTVVTMLDARDLSLIDAGAFMSYSTELYVSKENIYAIRGSTLRETTEENTTVTKAVTEISCMAYSVDGLTPKGTFTVDGTVKNQYSMDEKDGVFRVVTSTNLQQLQEHREDEFTSAMLKQERNANLTCFKVGTWEKLGELKAFAPEGETVESVRFDGNYAYVCTAEVVTMTDPVFFIDMTDLNHITARDTGVIEGYSSSFIQLGDGFLMGIGFGADGFLKVEIYEEGEGRVVSVCSYEEKAGFATAYKAYLIDRENRLFGIPTTEGYILLHFDGYHLHVLERVEMNGNLDNVRGVVIDEYLYVFGDSNVDGSAFEAVKFGQEEEM